MSPSTPSIGRSLPLGKIAGRITVLGLTLYIIILVYRSGEEQAAVALGGLVVLYAGTSLVRDLRYGLAPWEPVEWTTVSPGELEAGERRRSLRWAIALRGLVIVGAVSGLIVVFASGLDTLGYALLLAGLPALLVQLVKYYRSGTRPWHPSVPSRPSQLESDA